MQKTVNNFYEKTVIVLLNAKNRFYQCRKTNSIIVKFKHEKTFRFGI